MRGFIFRISVVVFFVFTGCELAHQFNWETNFDEGKVFVSFERGNDQYKGTRDKPLKSFNAGIARAFEKGYDTVYIEAGNYLPSQNGFRPAGTNIGINLTKGNIRIIGGWLDDFTRQGDDTQYSVLWNDDPILDHIVFINNLSNIYFEKIGFFGSSADGAAATDKNGGAVYIENSSNISFNSCVFINNSCDNNGGAIYVSNSSNIHFYRNYFENNLSLFDGGAVFLNNVVDCSIKGSGFIANNGNNGGAFGTNLTSKLLVQNTNFMNNVTPNWGGAVLIMDSNDIRLKNNGFMSNNASSGGALTLFNSSDCSIESYFAQNNATAEAGAVYQVLGSRTTVENSIFMSNYCTGVNAAGALYFENVNGLTIRESYIAHTSTPGGGITKNLYLANSSDIRLLQNYFDHSEALAPPEQTVTLGNNLTNVLVLMNVFRGENNLAGYAIFEEAEVNLPYRLEGNRFGRNSYLFLYHESVGLVDYTSVESLNNPDNIGASSAFLNSYE